MDPYAPFRPRAARWVAWALLVLIGAAVAILLLLSFTTLQGWGWADRILTVLFAGAGALVVFRQAAVVAIPSPAGLRVRNLFLSTEVTWAQIIRVNFAPGRPWVTLDLSDGDTLPVMAIQGADGAHGLREAQRLAELVRLSEPPDPAG